MNRGELRARCRLRADDVNAPYLWTNDEWNDYLDEAQIEACVRARLIVDDEGDACSLDIEPGVIRYPLHPAVLDVEEIKTPGGLVFTDWDMDEGNLILERSPSAAMSLTLTVVRIPYGSMTTDAALPEIRAQHHPHLVDWALRCAYLKKDAETFDQAASERHEALFEQYFGLRQTANVQRKHRRKSPRVTRAIGF